MSFTGRRENPILFNFSILKKIKDDSRDCHDLKKRGLAMTSKIPFLRRGKGKRISPFQKGGEGDLNIFLLRHCEERPMRRGNLIEPFFHPEEGSVFYRT